MTYTTTTTSINRIDLIASLEIAARVAHDEGMHITARRLEVAIFDLRTNTSTTNLLIGEEVS